MKMGILETVREREQRELTIRQQQRAEVDQVFDEISGGLSSQQTSMNRPKLPEVRAHRNRRAEKILQGHLHNVSTSTFQSSEASIPVLQQLDQTASRAARTHDISHLRDHGLHLAPKIPDSLLPKEDYVYERSFLPKNGTSAFKAEDGLWHTQVFPSSTAPSSRTDAIMLDQWISNSLEKYAARMSQQQEDLAQAVEELVPILTVALHEIVRQVTHYCVERGVVLEKIWRTYVELFDRVLKEMHTSLRIHKERTTEVQEVLRQAQTELETLRKNHPHQMQKVIAELEGRFTTRQKELESDLRAREKDNQALTLELRSHHTAIESWYPEFHVYQNSYIKNNIPNYDPKQKVQHRSSRGGHGHGEDEKSPELAMAEDFKRLLAALAPDKRKIIGKELAGLLLEQQKEQKSGKKGKRENQDEGARMLAILRAEVQEQEEKIKSLVAEVEALEPNRTFRFAAPPTEEEPEAQALTPTSPKVSEPEP